MQVQVSIQDKQVKAFLARAGSVGPRLMDALCRTYIPQGLKRIMAQAAQDAPVATGALQRSGTVSAMRTGKLRALGRIGFGGLAAKYAEVQHERTDFAHTLDDLSAKLGRNIERTHDQDGNPRAYDDPIRLGYHGGRAHWLYGTPGSAWQRNESWLRGTIQTGVTQIVRGLLAGG